MLDLAFVCLLRRLRFEKIVGELPCALGRLERNKTQHSVVHAVLWWRCLKQFIKVDYGFDDGACLKHTCGSFMWSLREAGV